MNIHHINLKNILPPKFDSRTVEDPDADSELLESIKQFGILMPISVKPQGKLYEIIFGHRRFRMACISGLPTIPCIISSSGEKETEIMKIHENLHRLPTSHIAQGRTFKYLRDTFNMKETEIATLVKKSIPYISQHLSLLESDQSVIDAVHSKQITFSTSRELIQVKNPSERKRLLDIVIENGASIDVLHNWVRQANEKPPEDNNPIIYKPDDPAPPYHSDPTFPCQACNRVTLISVLQIFRLCPDCAFNFKTAIHEFIKAESLKNTNEPT